MPPAYDRHAPYNDGYEDDAHGPDREQARAFASAVVAAAENVRPSIVASVESWRAFAAAVRETGEAAALTEARPDLLRVLYRYEKSMGKLLEAVKDFRRLVSRETVRPDDAPADGG